MYLKKDEPDPYSNNAGNNGAAVSNGAKKTKLKTASAAKTVNLRWALILLGWTFLISMGLSFLSSKALSGVGYALAFALLGAFILLGIVFDVIGIATASASEKPFHSMAARRVTGATEAIRLIRNAPKVSSFCNDVVGDIAGIISGTTSAVIVTRLAGDFTFDSVLMQFLISGLVAGLTVGGKAAGKSIALHYNTEIVHFSGRVVHVFRDIFSRLKSRR